MQRLLTKKDFREVYSYNNKYLGNKILIFYALSNSPNPRLGITIKKKWGKAHVRNRFKRVIREAYRQEYNKLPLNIELNIHPRKNFFKLTSKETRQELRNLINTCDQSKSSTTTCCQNN